jgi:CubicO group peptidase (beta-lactamase class C family)
VTTLTTTYPNAHDSDPIRLGWMQGSPPPPDKVVKHADGSFYRFPQLRWSFSHLRQLLPTTHIARGTGPIRALPLALRGDLDAVTWGVLGSGAQMTWAQAFDANYTDGIVVLQRGRIVYQRYAGALAADGQHIAHSVTKSLVGTLGATLLHEGLLDERKRVDHYVPELARSGLGSATLRQVMDMTSGVKYPEHYADPKADALDFVRAGGFFPRPAGYVGPTSFYETLQSIQRDGAHGQAFAYQTVNTDTLAWVMRRVTGQGFGQLLEQRIWRALGAEQDAYCMVDTKGTEFAGGGLNAGLRDLARFGEMLRRGGHYNGKQIVPTAVVEDIARGASTADFAKAGYPTLPGWSYRAMWWHTHNAHGAYMARGVHGQAIYIDPRAEMVIARFGSHPQAANVHLDPTSLPAYHALARYLVDHPG